VADRAALSAAIALARESEGPTLIERYIGGAELCVGILDDAVLGTVEVRPAEGFYDYQAKYIRDDTEYLIPPEAPEELVAAAEHIALQAHHALGCTGYSRVDLRVDESGVPHILEANTLPGMTSHSLLPKIAAHAGLDYPTLCERILPRGHSPAAKPGELQGA
jgi:D-alanine-D-alanine ligase